MDLYIGNKNYSTWSLRAWLLIAKYDLTFTEHKLKLETEEFANVLKTVAPIAKVPVLIDNKTTVWDSLAICEYINESYLSGDAWPKQAAHRAKARALANEMHSGFTALRSEMPMNIRATRQLNLSIEAQKDITRIEQIWTEQINEFGGQEGWLFGKWSIADAMFAPVALRFKTYGIKLNETASQYMQQVLNCNTVKQWIGDALNETEIVQMDEAGQEITF